MVKIGLISAMEEESQEVYAALGVPLEVTNEHGFFIRKYSMDEREYYVIRSGIGELSAALAAQYLAMQYGVKYLINFGLVGSLQPQYRLGDLVLAEKLVHYDFTTLYSDPAKMGMYPSRTEPYFYPSQELIRLAQNIMPSVKRGTIASADKFVNVPSLKEDLVRRFDAHICDMESAGILFACEHASLPCLFLKLVSDNADESAHETFHETLDRGTLAYVTLVKALARQLD